MNINCFNFYCDKDDVFVDSFNSKVIYLPEGKRAKNASNMIRLNIALEPPIYRNPAFSTTLYGPQQPRNDVTQYFQIATIQECLNLREKSYFILSSISFIIFVSQLTSTCTTHNEETTLHWNYICIMHYDKPLHDKAYFALTNNF